MTTQEALDKQRAKVLWYTHVLDQSYGARGFAASSQIERIDAEIRRRFFR